MYEIVVYSEALAKLKTICQSSYLLFGLRFLSGLYIPVTNKGPKFFSGPKMDLGF
jgi:hypothetical protein